MRRLVVVGVGLIGCHAPARERPLANVPAPRPPVVADGSISPALAMLDQGAIVVSPPVAMTDDVDGARLDAGELVEVDPECIDNPPDYERENDRYFACKGPTEAQEWRAAAEARSPQRATADWRKRAVHVYGPEGVLCDGTATGNSRFIGAWFATPDEVVGQRDAPDEAALATSVLAHNAALTTSLDAPCAAKGVAVRAANLPSLAIWRMEKAAPAIVDAVVKELRAYQYPTSEVFDQHPSNAAINATGDLVPTVVVARPAAGSGRVLVIATVTMPDCSLGEPTLGGIWELVDAVPTLERLALEPTDHDDGKFAPTLIADSGGDGWPEILTAQGIQTFQDGVFSYTPWLAFDDSRTGPICGD